MESEVEDLRLKHEVASKQLKVSETERLKMERKYQFVDVEDIYRQLRTLQSRYDMKELQFGKLEKELNKYKRNPQLLLSSKGSKFLSVGKLRRSSKFIRGNRKLKGDAS